ncbi:putative transcriptional regulator, TetR family protein [Streptomyces inusitatus]|uniref:Transcriptional regulator, TetR family protein n=1 Tax=Streptomyces inusitatus TaxID=68221 RepID=A0A918PL46_9ACTN|nr:TetR family transcriptional regulator [Streptomyces inusitatus]GGZ14884.1 putative transcriptional regulator, TetR family protein [Streptomyces inusitatus]
MDEHEAKTARTRTAAGVTREDAPESKGERTRRRILEAARRQFARVGFERATIRAIAAEAEVDKASVIQYFGTKQDLFREAVRWEIPIAELTTDDPGESVENYLRTMLSGWSRDPDSPMTALVRASMTGEEAAELLRRRITEQAVDPIAAAIDGPDARLRSALVGAMMMGIATQRHLLRMPDLAEADLEDILRLSVPLLRSLIAPAE